MTAKPKLVKPRFLSHLDPYAVLWICRIGVNFPNAIDGINAGMYLDEIRTIIGISPLEGKLNKVTLRAMLKVRMSELEAELPTLKLTLVRNVSMFAELLGLDKLEQDILLFSAMAQRHPYLSEFMDGIRTTSVDAIARLLAAALKVTEAAATKALRLDGELFASRMVTLESGYTTNGFKLEFSPTLLTALFSEADDLKMLMSSFVESAPPATLAEADFTHLAAEMALLQSYLLNASNTTKASSKVNDKATTPAITGTNILIYGQAGTGKTEFVKYLAASLNKQLYQVRDSNDQGTPINGAERLAFFQLTQRFLHKSNALILFDEIEDVFPDTNSSALEALFSRRAVVGKMHINRILENNPVPTIWVSNHIGHIDKAYLRRFDFSMEIGVPPVSVRRGILQNYLQPYKISAATIEHLSQQELLSPAQIEKAAKVLKLSAAKAGVKASNNVDAKHNAQPATDEEKLMLIIDNSMALLSQDKIDANFNLAECSYQLDFLNPDCDVKHLVAQLKLKPDATGALCFYGVPGSGKTALAHFIASELELPLMARKASDIISPYVGETEQKIASMFRKAQEDNALLLLDEADSFLTDRKSAQNSWEITAVNEMLTQMESFRGLFICSTNLMQKLDEASLRRFALKIRFDYLKPNQRMQLFMAQLQTQADNKQAQLQKLTPEIEFECRAALNQLHNLTPGDFAVVRRQAMLLSMPLSAPELLNRLKQECRAKSDSNSRPIGFLQSH